MSNQSKRSAADISHHFLRIGRLTAPLLASMSGLLVQAECVSLRQRKEGPEISCRFAIFSIPRLLDWRAFSGLSTSLHPIETWKIWLFLTDSRSLGGRISTLEISLVVTDRVNDSNIDILLSGFMKWVTYCVFPSLTADGSCNY